MVIEVDYEYKDISLLRIKEYEQQLFIQIEGGDKILFHMKGQRIYSHIRGKPYQLLVYRITRKPEKYDKIGYLRKLVQICFRCLENKETAKDKLIAIRKSFNYFFRKNQDNLL